jgi:hypothetical protein
MRIRLTHCVSPGIEIGGITVSRCSAIVAGFPGFVRQTVIRPSPPAQIDWVVMPSIWWENSPVVIQEAFAAGRPVICTGMGGMAEKVLPGVSGRHFRRGDAAHLAQVIQAAANAQTLAKLQAGLPRPADAPTMARHYLAALGLPLAEATAEAAQQPRRKPRRAAARLSA